VTPGRHARVGLVPVHHRRLNVVILVGIVKVFREMRRGTLRRGGARGQLNAAGMMNRFFGPLDRQIDTPCAAGMSLLDTADGVFMNFAYGWAFFKPIRKVYYNITITGLSVVVAMLIGTIEIFALLASQLNLSGGFWAFMSSFNINEAGFIIVGLFVVTWVAALGIWRFGRIEQRWETAASQRRSA
jgi:high-affinity nickel-transport protein